MNKKIAFGLKLSIFNLFLVALLGVIMRYKIAFSFPFLSQKHIQESHYHFAFYGWIASCIYIFIAEYLHKTKPELNLKKYQNLILVNFLASYGILFSFLVGGHSWYSSAFSFVAILVGFGYLYAFIKDSKSISDTSKPWFLGGLFFAVLSSVGVFALIYMMLTKHILQDIYLGTSYFFLHFQYNGFFLFGCVGLLIYSLKEIGVELKPNENKQIFWLLFIGCFVGFGLSILWAKLPLWFFIPLVIATFMQTYGAVKLFQFIRINWSKIKISWTALQRFVLIYVGFAFGVKTLLQLASNIPAVSQFAFGFRNIVIAYLHLILLMCISTFLVNQVVTHSYFKTSKLALNALILFMVGIFLNELILGLMGIFSIKYISVPHAHEALVYVSALILFSVALLFIRLIPKKV